MNDIFEELKSIKKALDEIDINLAMNSEAIESIEMELRFLEIELDNEINKR